MSGPVMVKLVDGTTVNRDSEEWRHECLARWFLRLDLPQRQAWLAEYEQKHGAEIAQRLKTTVIALHAKAKAERMLGT